MGWLDTFVGTNTYIPGWVRVAKRGMRHSIVSTTCTVTNNVAISAQKKRIDTMMNHTLSIHYLHICMTFPW